METTIEVADPSHVAETRRAVSLMAHSTGLGDDLAARAALVTSELATNILKYARCGTITVATNEQASDLCGLDITAFDRGPGISDLEASLKDGHSTGGSLGFGLGTIQRAAAVFDVYTQPGQGTGMFVRLVDARSRPTAGQRFEVGWRAVPMRGEPVSGDAWAAVPFGQALAVTVVDGLGHGPKAAIAATLAIDTFNSRVRAHGPARTLAAAHDALRSTRGAVMAIGVIDPSADRIRFASVGNINAVLLGNENVVRLPASDGTVGYGNRTVRESDAPWSERSVLVLHSDGLSSKWNLAGHPGLLAHHPMLIAGVLHRDFGRDNDDATVVVVKNAPA